MQPAYSVEFAPTKVWVIDRRNEAATVVARIASNQSRLMVLHGPDEAGKTAFLFWWVMPTLLAHFPVYYGKCTTSLPAHLKAVGDAQEIPLSDALGGGGVVFLDDFDCFFSQSTASQRQELVQTLRQVKAKTVLVSSDEHLGTLLSLRTEIPELFENRIELDALSLEESIERLRPPEGEVRCPCSPEFIEALHEDLASFQQTGNNLSPSVLTVLAAEMHQRLFLTPGTVLQLSHYQQAGGIRSLLDSYLSKVLNSVPQSIALPSVARFVLERLASTSESTGEDFALLAARIESDQEVCNKVFDWLMDTSGLLKSSCDGRVQLLPPLLTTLLEEQVSLRSRAAKPALQIVQNGFRSWNELGTILPASRFEEVHQFRVSLVLTKEQTIFLAQSALGCAHSGNNGPARYWLRRVTDPDEELGILLRALASKDAGVRCNAINLLGGYRNPEIQSELYRAALEDGDTLVRSEARSALALFESLDAIWSPVAQEARDPGSPFRIAAIQALRVFRTAAAAELLNSLVSSSGSESEARVAAIQSLSASGTADAIEALVKIALRDEDQADREGAASELAKLNSPELAASAVACLRAEEIRVGEIAPKFRLLSVPTILFRYLVTAVLGLVGLIFPPSFSFFIRWYATGSVLTLAWLTGLLAWWFTDTHMIVAAGLLTVGFIGYLLAYLLPAGYLMRRRAHEHISGRSYEGALGAYLFVAVAFASFFTVHGILHFLVRTWRKGRLLFTLQILGTLCIAFFFIARAAYNIGIVSRVGTFYLIVGIVLWLATWLWDVVWVGESLLRPAAVLVRERQGKLCQVLLGNNFVAGAVLQGAESPDAKTRKWARSLTHRFADSVPDLLWIELIRTRGAGAPGWCYYGLQQAKFLGGASDIQSLWRGADRRLRSRLVGVLALNPSEASARCLQTILPELGWLDRLRYSFDRFWLRLQVVPASVWLCGFLLMPIIAGLVLEAVYVAQDSSRLLVRIVASPQAIANQPSFVTATAAYLLQAHPKRAEAALSSLRRIVHGQGQERLEAIAVLTSNAGQFEHPAAAEGARKLLAEIVPDIRAMLLTTEVTRSSGTAAQTRTQRRLIAALRAVNDDTAAGALRDIALQFSKPVLGDRVISAPLRAIEVPANRDLCNESIRALGGMPLASAGAALGEIRDRAGASSVRAEAANEYAQMTTRLVDGIRADLDDGALEKVVAAAPGILALLSAADGQNASRLWAVVAQAKARRAETTSDPNKAVRLGNEAITDVDRAAALGQTELSDEDASFIYLRQAERLSSTGKYTEALSMVNRAVKFAPKAPDIRSTRASILFNSNRPDEALSELATVQKLRPDYAFAYRLEGEIEMRRSNYARAVTRLNKAIELDPTDGTAYSFLGEIFHRQNQDHEGIKVLQSLFERHNSSGALLSQMFMYHENLSATEPSAFQENYRLHHLLLGRFGGTLGTDDSVLASFTESSFTSGHTKEAIQRATSLLQKQGLPPRIALPVNVILCAAYVSANERSLASSRMQEIQRLLSSGKVVREDWSYQGVSNYVRSTSWDQDMKTKYMDLLNQISKDPQKVTPDILQALRQELARKS